LEIYTKQIPTQKETNDTPLGAILEILNTFPNKTFNKNELKLVADIALEFRQRVRDWLHKIALGDFLKRDSI